MILTSRALGRLLAKVDAVSVLPTTDPGDGKFWLDSTNSLVAGPPDPLTFPFPLTRTDNVVSLPAATAGQSGYLTAANWVTFNGKADLVGGKLPAAQLPDIAIVENLGSAADEPAMLALVGQKGDFCTRTDTGTIWSIVGDDPTQLGDWFQMVYPVAAWGSIGGTIGDQADLAAAFVSKAGDTMTGTLRAGTVEFNSASNYIEASTGNMRVYSGDGSLVAQFGSTTATFYKATTFDDDVTLSGYLSLGKGLEITSSSPAANTPNTALWRYGANTQLWGNNNYAAFRNGAEFIVGSDKAFGFSSGSLTTTSNTPASDTQWRRVSANSSKFVGADGTTLGTVQAGTFQATTISNPSGNMLFSINGNTTMNTNNFAVQTPFSSPGLTFAVNELGVNVYRDLRAIADNSWDAGSATFRFRTGRFATSVETPRISNPSGSLTVASAATFSGKITSSMGTGVNRFFEWTDSTGNPWSFNTGGVAASGFVITQNGVADRLSITSSGINTLGGSVTASNILPDADGTRSVGSDSLRFKEFVCTGPNGGGFRFSPGGTNSGMHFSAGQLTLVDFANHQALKLYNDGRVTVKTFLAVGSDSVTSTAVPRLYGTADGLLEVRKTDGTTPGEIRAGAATFTASSGVDALKLKAASSSSNSLVIENHNSTDVSTYFDRNGYPHFSNVYLDTSLSNTGTLALPFTFAGTERMRIENVRFWASTQMGFGFKTHNGTTQEIATWIDHRGNLGVANSYTPASSDAGSPAKLYVETNSATKVGQIIKAEASQTANLQEWQDDAGTVLAAVNNDGDIIKNRGTQMGFRLRAPELHIGHGSFVVDVASGGTWAQKMALDVNGKLTVEGAITSKQTISAISPTSQVGPALQRTDGLVPGGSMPAGLWMQDAFDLRFRTSTVDHAMLTWDGRFAIGDHATRNEFSSTFEVRTKATQTGATATFKAKAAQTANLQEWQDSAGTVLASMNPTGSLAVAQQVRVNGTSGTDYTVYEKNRTWTNTTNYRISCLLGVRSSEALLGHYNANYLKYLTGFTASGTNAGSIAMFIDADNSTTDSVFAIHANETQSAAVPANAVFKVAETGNVTATGAGTFNGGVVVADTQRIQNTANTAFIGFDGTYLNTSGVWENAQWSHQGHWALAYHGNRGVTGAPMVVGGHLGLAAASSAVGAVDTRIARQSAGVAAILAATTTGDNTTLGNWHAAGYLTRSGTANPIVLDIIAGYATTWKNTTSGEVRHWANDSGTMKRSLPLTAAGSSVVFDAGATFNGALTNGLVNREAFGAGASAPNQYETAFGPLADASGNPGTAFGYNARATGAYTLALGYSPQASGVYSLALGMNTIASHTGSIAFGAAAASTKANQLVLGSVTYPIAEVLFPGDFTFAGGAATFVGVVKAAGVVQATEPTALPAGITQTVSLASNHQTVSLVSTTGDTTITLNGPTGSAAGTIIVKQHATTPRDITWAAGTGVTNIIWLGTEPTWSGDTASKVRIVSWRYDGADLYLVATESS